MKTVGLLGGMSWESTSEYYRLINTGVKKALGGFNSAKILLYSVNFQEIEVLQRSDNWDKSAEILADAAVNLQKIGAETLVIATNTMHKVATSIERAIDIPLLHIVDATGEKLQQSNIKKVALLATAFTMEQDFYKSRLAENFNLEVIVPDSEERQFVHQVIYKELCLGKILDSSRERYKVIIKKLVEQGAEAIILGCTEIGLLVKQKDVDIPLFDTTEIHCKKIVDYILDD